MLLTKQSHVDELSAEELGCHVLWRQGWRQPCDSYAEPFRNVTRSRGMGRGGEGRERVDGWVKVIELDVFTS